MFVIPIDEGSRTPLPTVEVGVSSAFRALIVGVSDDLENVQVHFGSSGGASYSAVPATATPGGNWQVYASPIYFLTAGGSRYFVTATTPRGDSIYLGSGGLYVMASPQNGEATIVPADTYLRNPETGLWHRFTCTVGEDGDMLPEIDKQGVAR